MDHSSPTWVLFQNVSVRQLRGPTWCTLLAVTLLILTIVDPTCPWDLDMALIAMATALMLASVFGIAYTLWYGAKENEARLSTISTMVRVLCSGDGVIMTKRPIGRIKVNYSQPLMLNRRRVMSNSNMINEDHQVSMCLLSFLI
uniref:DNA replication ATP-dependent helicase dna2 n=1 Tax=Anthurium amnicola TaxID=1678845 RepID=A0A1D1XD09_9ARAE